MIRRLPLAIALCSLPALTGCPAEDYSRCPEKFVSLPELLAEHNANAAKVPRLWARVRVRVSGPGFAWGSASSLAAPNALLVLSKEQVNSGPPNFLLRGREMVELFRLGVDARAGLYYLWLNINSKGEAWFGRTKYAGAPAAEGIPLDPTQLVEVLGVTALPPLQPEKTPAVVLRLQSLPRPAYVLRYLSPQPVTGHLKVWREVYLHWDEKKPRRAYRVRLFDAAGLCRVVADLADYKPIATGAEEAEAPPVMPTDIRMTWPAIKGVQEASTLHMRLSEMAPKAVSVKAFDFWEGLPPALEPVQVDSAYGKVPPGGAER